MHVEYLVGIGEGNGVLEVSMVGAFKVDGPHLAHFLDPPPI